MLVSFNLVDREWIPCVTPTGEMAHKSILAALESAGQIQEIRDESPLVTVSLHRLLLAILHRVFGPESPAEWGDLWNNGSGRFDAPKLRAYLRSSKIHPRFDLFDANHPFYQVANLPIGELDKKNMGRPKLVKPIWRMAHELACSDTMNRSGHLSETDWDIRPAAEVARWLVAFQAFALGGLITTEEGKKAQDGSADAGHLVKSAVVLAKGKNLFQTLMLNLVRYSEDDGVPFNFEASRDKPAWEHDEPVRPADRPFDGYLDLLTWQSRRVKLIAAMGPNGELFGVSGVVAMKGWQLPGFERAGRETMVGFVKPEKVLPGHDPWPPLGFRAGKELWRDCHALFQSVAEGTQRPQVLSWINDLRGRFGLLDWKEVQIVVAGMCVDRAKIYFWRHESLPLPLAYLDEEEPIGGLKKALTLAAEVGKALRAASWATVATRLAGDAGMRPDKDRVGNLLNSFAPESLYWSRLEIPFRTLLNTLAEAGTPERRSVQIQNWFYDALHRTAVVAFANTVGRPNAGRDLKAVTAGSGVLWSLLRKVQRTNNILDRDKKEGAA
ncbi:MAG: type I-E CRISPR-associated protein Cse1/CasA [Planctomycetaceae bacterium]|nr:type I-E CRISPR-associated protein Cse1/CasA [Planctomycetaceae bacterium]